MEHRIRVLIADDRPRSRDGLRAILSTLSTMRRCGQGNAWPEVEVVGDAANGREAVRLVGERHPDVVLMDVRMPLMDGLEATRLIKDQWPEVKVIVLTMYDVHWAALAAGADAVVAKGDPPERLLATLRRVSVAGGREET